MEEKRNQEKRNPEAELTGEEMEALMKRIRESSEEICVPGSLEPEAVKARLRGRKEKKRLAAFPVRRFAEAAAVVALVALMGGAGLYGGTRESGQAAGDAAESAETGSGQAAAGGMDGGMASADGGAAEEAEEVENVPKKATVGSYRLASSYEEVYAAVNEAAGSTGVLFNEMDVEESGTAYKEEAAEDYASDGETMASSGDFSKTNTQVEGVDESDFIKNDGSYLYVLSGDTVHIVDIQGDAMETVATVAPELDAGAEVCEMYVDGDSLYLIVQKRDVELDERSESTEEVASSADIAYFVDDDMTVELQTYDISDRARGTLVGTVSQDGSYYSSRKAGDYIYLFTRKTPYGGNLYADSASSVIPTIGGGQADCDCIYVQDQAASELIISSVDTGRPSEIADYLVLMNNYAQIYMGTEAIYLYSEDYEYTETDDNGISTTTMSRSYTDIAKFSYQDGRLDGVGAATVRGTIGDTFAISEGSGSLRVLTTEWSSDSVNHLYLLDENLKVEGSLKDLARGEEIYAARYIGDTAYFITYHNTDPLFAVDISDPTDPKLLGELSITGFSDYLHPYGDGLLLGIGYETDPDTSERLGVKLVMFDISDPADLRIVDTVTVDGGYCAAADYYKSALADAGKNLIGFEVTDWDEGNGTVRYYLYSWKDGTFTEELKVKLDNGDYWDESRIRGLYAGSRFYLASPTEAGFRLCSYDMGAGFEKVDELVLE